MSDDSAGSIAARNGRGADRRAESDRWASPDWRPRLIATDMDGTLLRGDDTVSRRTVAELERWRADGVPIVLATGRPPRWMHRIRETLGWGTAICCNGAVLLDLARFEILDEIALEATTLRELTAELRRHVHDVGFAVEYGLEFRHEPHYQPHWDVAAPGVAQAPLEELVAAPAAKLLARSRATGRDAFVALIEQVVGDRATVTNSSDQALAEISAPGVTKATGLAAVAARHGIGPEDVVVFGDMPNDIAAFDWVREGGGRAVAMSHAHPDLLVAATDVTATNEDDGVALFLEAL